MNPWRSAKSTVTGRAIAVEVQPAEALLGSLPVRHHRDDGRTPAASARATPTTTPARLRPSADRDHRLREQDEGDREAEQQPRAALRGRARGSGRPRRRRAPRRRATGRRAGTTAGPGRPSRSPRGRAPATRSSTPRARSAALARAASAARARWSSAESAASAAASKSPTGVAITKPRFGLSRSTSGRRQRVQGEEPGGGEEGERHEVDAPVAAAACRDTGRVGEDRVEPGADEDEPEVRRLVLPVDVRVGSREQDREPDQRQREQSGDEGQRAPRTCSR